MTDAVRNCVAPSRPRLAACASAAVRLREPPLELQHVGQHRVGQRCARLARDPSTGRAFSGGKRIEREVAEDERLVRLTREARRAAALEAQGVHRDDAQEHRYCCRVLLRARQRLAIPEVPRHLRRIVHRQRLGHGAERWIVLVEGPGRTNGESLAWRRRGAQAPCALHRVEQSRQVGLGARQVELRHGKRRVLMHRRPEQLPRARPVALVERPQAGSVRGVRSLRAGAHVGERPLRRRAAHQRGELAGTAVGQREEVHARDGVRVAHVAGGEVHPSQVEPETSRRHFVERAVDHLRRAGHSSSTGHRRRRGIAFTGELGHQLQHAARAHHLEPRHAREVGGEHVAQRRRSVARRALGVVHDPPDREHRQCARASAPAPGHRACPPQAPEQRSQPRKLPAIRPST